jgi:hypothetical protein
VVFNSETILSGFLAAQKGEKAIARRFHRTFIAILQDDHEGESLSPFTAQISQ